ncbi:MAG: glycyl-radical enzyme activating protein [Candidatus Thorarchaeota archaeon]
MKRENDMTRAELVGLVTNIQRFSVEDGPGIRTTVFLKGCPMSCTWCHNIEAVDPHRRLVWHSKRCIGDGACVTVCPNGALSLRPTGMLIRRDVCQTCGTCLGVCVTSALEIIGKTWTPSALVEEVLRDRVFFETSNGGITFSGGEPTYQPDFLIDSARLARDNGLHVAVETSGYCSAEVFERLLGVVDLVLYDLKQIDPSLHLRFTGVSLDRILSNARLLGKSSVPVWVRTPVIPGHTDSPDNIRGIASFVAESLPSAERWELLAFNNMCIDKYRLLDIPFALEHTPQMTADDMQRLVALARESVHMPVRWSGPVRVHRADNHAGTAIGSTCGSVRTGACIPPP